jgi:hypothetical protein
MEEVTTFLPEVFVLADSPNHQLKATRTKSRLPRLETDFPRQGLWAHSVIAS